MAKNRIINTKFWTDTYILNELNPIDKLLFLYLITNPYTDISGIYELPLKIMAVETGIDKENIEKVILPRLEKDGKIKYKNGWVAIKNFQKHQTINPKVKMGMEVGMSKAPLELRRFIELDSLSIENDSLSHLNSNSNSNSNSNEPSHSDGVDSFSINTLIGEFEKFNQSSRKWYKNKTQRAAAKRLIELHGIDKLIKVVNLLPKTNSTPYMPTITTIVQLEDKWTALESGFLRKKQELKNKENRYVL